MSFRPAVSGAIRRTFEMLVPSPLARRVVQRHLLRERLGLRMRFEPELHLLGDLVRAETFAVDIGANIGNYAIVLSGVCPASRIVCFEPVPMYQRRLRRMLPGAVIAGIAVSDRNGRATLSIPIIEDVPISGRATVEPSMRELGQTGVRELDVSVTTLDSYAERHGLEPIGFVKIDVEGHELAVLRGAARVLQVQRPRLVVEVEQRHHHYPLERVFDEILRHGYVGIFIDMRERGVCPLAAFDRIVHQPISRHGTRSYVANFIFLPAEEEDSIVPSLQDRLRRARWDDR